ncbi:DUF4258 domain-containing protein [Methylorubrum zatmanii]|uniref:DUF4258 domain-containing protein n=1 Tax=Methylorubrum zatmanii TaxID=29429 RepID=A0ABW1WNS2_9HYPH|nr:hypothetical protein [Methylorubrum zatmanii]
MSPRRNRPTHLRAVSTDFADEAARLRALASNPRVRVRYTKHALEEMAKDSLVRIDIENMLRRCRVVLVEESQGELTWRAQGSDNNGGMITAVVVAYEEEISIKIITAWS